MHFMADNLCRKYSKSEISFSKSEKRGISLIKESDMQIFCPGISTCGFAETRIALQNPERKVIATTIDKKGIARTRSMIKELDLADRIDVRIEDVTKPMTYPDNHFDFIYARLILHYLNEDDLDKALKEFYRTLKPTGSVFIVVRSTDDWESRLKGSTYDTRTRMTTYPVYDSKCRNTGKKASRYFHTVESISGHVKRAGFVIEYTKKYEEQLYHDYMRTSPVIKKASVIEILTKK